jgi:hypothetical protein
MKRVITPLTIAVILILLSFSHVFAQYSSTNFQTNEVMFGTGGDLDASSPNYKAQSSVGALGVDHATTPIAFVQGNQNFSSGVTSSLASAFSSNVAAGHLIVVAYSSSQNSSTVSDSLGTSFSVAVSRNDNISGSPYYTAIAWGVAPSTGADTVTLAIPGGAPFDRLAIHEYSGANALDVTSSDTGNSATLNTGSATTRHSIELAFGWMVSDNGVASAGSGYTLRETAGSESTMDKTVGAVGSYNVTAPTSSSSWSALMATFYASNGTTQAFSGFLTPNEPFLEMTVNTSLADLGVLDSTAAKTANANFNVRAYTNSGYTVITMSQPPQTNGGLTLTPMAAQGSSTPGTEQFGMNLVANTAPASFGADPSKQPDSTFADGKAAPGYDTANQYKYNAGDLIAETNDSGWGQTNYTISYIANITSITRAGQYSMVHDLVVVPTY